MIKAAGVAGALAWTAPVIIDSLSSPAAAVTAPKGCFRMFNNLTSSGWGGWGTANNSGLTCDVTASECTAVTDAAAAAALGTPTPVPADDSGTTVTISVNPGYSCTIVAAGAVVQFNNTDNSRACRQRDTDGTSGDTEFNGLGTGTVTINPDAGDGDEWDNNGTSRSAVVIVLQCGA
jgi:hypothetical protein